LNWLFRSLDGVASGFNRFAEDGGRDRRVLVLRDGSAASAEAQGNWLFDSTAKAGSRQARSIPPLLMPHRQAVELVPIEPPLGHEPVKEIDEPRVVGGFQQVGHFMDHDVFEAFLGFLG